MDNRVTLRLELAKLDARRAEVQSELTLLNVMDRNEKRRKALRKAREDELCGKWCKVGHNWLHLPGGLLVAELGHQPTKEEVEARLQSEGL